MISSRIQRSIPAIVPGILVAGGVAWWTLASSPGTHREGPRHEVDLERARSTWPGAPAIESVEDLFRVVLTVGERRFVVGTHLFAAPLEVIPFHNEDGVEDADGRAVERGDGALARYFPPGEIGFAVRHRRPTHRSLDVGADLSALREELKLRDGHTEMVVGVMRDGRPGVITVNLPQAYERGRFGDRQYPMIFFRPIFPDYLGEELRRQFLANVRTMMIGFDAVARFPISYSRGDPVAARDTSAVRDHARMMVRAIAGERDGMEWFKQREHLLYCSELGHLATSAGLLLPLNADTFVPLVGDEVWRRFEELVAAHNRGGRTPFVDLNDNPWISAVELAIAPRDLRPAPLYAPSLRESAELAFYPMTLADIVEQFLRLYLPREQLGEEVAPWQGKLLAALKPVLWEATGFVKLSPDDPRAVEADAVYGRLMAIVAQPFSDYDAFRKALSPVRAEAAELVGPRGGGAGLYIPPSLFHLMAQKRWPGGLVDVEYVGHGLHYSLVRRVSE